MTNEYYEGSEGDRRGLENGLFEHVPDRGPRIGPSQGDSSASNSRERGRRVARFFRNVPGYDFANKHPKAVRNTAVGILTGALGASLYFGWGGNNAQNVNSGADFNGHFEGVIKNRKVVYDESREGIHMKVTRGDGTGYEFFDTVDFEPIPDSTNPQNIVNHKASLEKVILRRPGVEPIVIVSDPKEPLSWAETQYSGLLNDANEYFNGMREEIAGKIVEDVQGNVKYFERVLGEDFSVLSPRAIERDTGALVIPTGPVDFEPKSD